MIIKSIPTKSFDISYNSETRVFTLSKKTGQTWHKVSLNTDDVFGILDLLADMKEMGILYEELGTEVFDFAEYILEHRI